MGLTAEHLFKRPVFSWGASNLIKQGQARNAYLKALRQADAGEYKLLIAFFEIVIKRKVNARIYFFFHTPT